MDAQTARALDACIEREAPDPAAEPWERLVDVEGRCPRVHAWLAAEAGRRGLAVSNPRVVHHDELSDLAHLVAPGARGTPARSARFERATLDRLIGELTLPETGGPSVWRRFLEWLAGYLEPAGDESPWLHDLLDALAGSEEAMRIAFRVAIALLILTALVVVGNELRLFGWRGRAPAYRRGLGGEARSPDDGAAHAGPAASSPRERVAQGLAVLYASVRDGLRGRARPGARTTRDLVRALTPGDTAGTAARGQEIRETVAAIERVIYGDEPVDAEGADALFRACERLAGPGAARTGPGG